MKTKIEDLNLIRVNVTIEEDCKDWFMFKAKSMGMSMSNLMSFILSNYYESCLNQEATRLIADASRSDNVRETCEAAKAMTDALNGLKK